MCARYKDRWIYSEAIRQLYLTRTEPISDCSASMLEGCLFFRLFSELNFSTINSMIIGF